jgi:hypothetical protein
MTRVRIIRFIYSLLLVMAVLRDTGSAWGKIKKPPVPVGTAAFFRFVGLFTKKYLTLVQRERERERVQIQCQAGVFWKRFFSFLKDSAFIHNCFYSNTLCGSCQQKCDAVSKALRVFTPYIGQNYYFKAYSMKKIAALLVLAAVLAGGALPVFARENDTSDLIKRKNAVYADLGYTLFSKQVLRIDLS